MKYVVTNYYCISGVYLNSEPMEYEEALKSFKDIEKNARRGLREFPDLLDENGNVIM